MIILATSNHNNVDVPVGHKIRIVTDVRSKRVGEFDYQEARLIIPPYTGKLCGINSCVVTMPAPGPGQAYAIQIEIDTYYASNPHLPRR